MINHDGTAASNFPVQLNEKVLKGGAIYDINNNQLINYTNDWFTDDQISWDESGEKLYFVSPITGNPIENNCFLI